MLFITSWFILFRDETVLHWHLKLFFAFFVVESFWRRCVYGPIVQSTKYAITNLWSSGVLSKSFQCTIYHLWLFFISEKCYYLKWHISNCSVFNCLDTQGSVLTTVVFWTCSEKNGYLCTDVSRRGRNFTAHFSLMATAVSRFMITFVELLPSWEEFPFQTISMGDLYKDVTLPYLFSLVLRLKCVVSLENYLEPSVLLLASENCLTVVYVTIFLYSKKENKKKKSFKREKGEGLVNRKHLEACSVTLNVWCHCYL